MSGKGSHLSLGERKDVWQDRTHRRYYSSSKDGSKERGKMS